MKPNSHRADGNQEKLLKELRKIPGLSVQVVGHLIDQYDLVVGMRGRSYLFELKSNEKAKLRESQKNFSRIWTGHWERVETLADIMIAIGLGDKRG